MPFNSAQRIDSKAEHKILKELAERKDIVIKPADKDGSIVIWPIEKYKKKYFEQLSNHAHYTKLDSNPTSVYSNLVQSTIAQLLSQQLIAQSDYRFMMPNNKESARFTFFLSGRLFLSGRNARQAYSVK